MPGGRIVTFYSFKGGVGRTMALANTALLAAMNGLRVLVMDWDLEAPGLHQYFRGLMDPEEMGRIKERPGVLDLAWDWRIRVEAATTREGIEEIFADFRSGRPFERNLVPVVSAGQPEVDGTLDMITAGARVVGAPGPVGYEQALAAFSWNDFLGRYAGGGMLDALRSWALSNYDLTLVDSRTGLADVAGICTMQLPDAVILAFVFNRQNIEGVARVAGAVRQARGADVELMAVPMRGSRERTAEEADAVARAVRELVRVGGFTREQAERDMRSLAIKAEPDVPFMEALAPFHGTDAALDPLTANIARLTQRIIGRNVVVPAIDEHWRELVNSRSAPSLSTVTYLRQLLAAEPSRATREVHRFLESALSTLVEEQSLTREYVGALVETALALHQRGEPNDEGYDLVGRSGLLVRRLYDADQDQWRSLLIAVLQASLDASPAIFYEDDEIVALEEIDELLGQEGQSVDVLTRRAELRLRIARVSGIREEGAQRLAAGELALAHVVEARRQPGGNGDELRLLGLEAMLQKADGLAELLQQDAAARILKEIAKSADEFAEGRSRAEATRLSFEANYRLMRMSTDNVQQAAKFAEAAIVRAQPGSSLLLTRASELGNAVVASGGAPAIRALLARIAPASPAAAIQAFASAPRAAVAFLEMLASLVEALAVGDRPPGDVIATAVGVAAQAVEATSSRLARFSHRGTKRRFGSQYQAILPLFAAAGGRLLDAIEPGEGAVTVRDAGESLRAALSGLLKLSAHDRQPDPEQA